MKKILMRYKVFGAILAVNLLLLLIKPGIGVQSLIVTADNLKEMLFIMPPVFVLLGLLDVWVQRETMVKLMGKDSGLLGMVMAFFLGSVAAGPLYVSFPFAGVLMKKGSKLSNVLIFIGAWSATKIPISLYEASLMGWKFMLCRYFIDILVIVLIAHLTEKSISAHEQKIIYEKVINIE